MAIGVGLDSYIMLGEEATYGTAVTRDLGLLHNSESLRADVAMREADSIYRVGRHGRARAVGAIEVAGDIAFHPRYSNRGFTRFLKHAMGSVVTAQPDITSNPLVYQHTFTPADALPTGLSIEVAKSVKAHLHTGCKITNLRMNGSATERMSCSVSFIGREQTVLATPTALALVAGEGNLVVFNSASLSWNGVSQLKVTDFEFGVQNGLQRMNYISSQYTAEPVRNGHRVVTGKFSVHFEDDVLYNEYRNKPLRAMVATIQGAVISGAYNYEIQITANVAELQDAVPGADSMGPLVVPCSFECYMNDTNANEVSIRVTNTQSAA